jgi:glyoxylase-like metal-dependent hydrolase (beta-lactamase superfamily II)
MPHLIPEVTPAQLHAELTHNRDLLILDIRGEDEVAQWHIEGRRPLAMINVPYRAFRRETETAVAALPSDRELTVVCARGRTSAHVTEILLSRGFRVRHLTGGMLAWSELYVPHVAKSEAEDGLLLVQFNRVGKGCLSYLVASEGEAAVIDAGRDGEQYADYALAHGLQICAVLDTHLHADHISGGRSLARLTGAPYYLPPADATQVTFPREPLDAGRRIRVGRVVLEAVGSPGHTRGSTSLLVDNRFLLTGDTLFVRSVGRPDLGGEAETLVLRLYRTLYETYRALPDEVEFYPTHYSSQSELDERGICVSTLGAARRSNRVLQALDPDSFVTTVLGNMPPTPANYDRIRLLNMGQPVPDVQEERELEIGPNHCAAG